ncbi:MAG: hypothetical protein NVS4B7_08430 [Ktedonobacteraceae bacterium]
MVQIYDSSLALQEQPLDGEGLIKASNSAENYTELNKQALMYLLKLELTDLLAQGKTLNLDVNEEFTRLIPVICTYFSREELTQLLGTETTATFFEMYRTEALQNLFLEGELQNVLRAFNQANIPLMLFKGPTLAYTVYPQPHMRTYHDIDALVHPADISRAHALLLSMGYTFYEEFRGNALDKNRTGYNYTLQRSHFALEVLIELHTAPHTGEIATIFDVDALWQQAQPITVLGQQALMMAPIDHLLYLCWHYRFHGFSRLIWLYDLVAMLRSFDTNFDWHRLVQAAHQQRLATTLYYCLSWCHDLFGVVIPQYVFMRLRPPLACRFIVERVTMPHPARALVSPNWQPRRILAHRAMVDSTSALLAVGLRAFFPTPTILAKRYMQSSRLPLQLYFLFYFIHPLLTLAKGFRYLLERRLKQK